MTVAFPWSGRDFNALVPLSGRAAVPNTPAGTGFNWPSLVGRVSGYIRPVRGGGFRGLGQPQPFSSATDITSTLETGTSPIGGVSLVSDPNAPIYVAADFPTAASAAASGASATSTQAPWWGNILSSAITSGLKVGSQIASYELNPLTNKATYFQTPQGGIYASNVPGGVPGLTTPTTGSSILPMLLIGGVVVMFMMSRR